MTWYFLAQLPQKKHVMQKHSAIEDLTAFQVEHMSRRIHPVRGHEKVPTQ